MRCVILAIPRKLEMIYMDDGAAVTINRSAPWTVRGIKSFLQICWLLVNMLVQCFEYGRTPKVLPDDLL